MTVTIPIARLNEVLVIGDDGVLIWKCNVGRAIAGSSAGTVSNWGYIRFGIDGHDVLAHRAIWAITHGRWPREGMVLDHIDGDKLNNRPENLREIPQRQNTQNMRSATRRNRSGSSVPGVHCGRPGKYVVALRIGGKKRHFGVYDTLNAAEDAAIRCRRRYLEGNTL